MATATQQTVTESGKFVFTQDLEKSLDLAFSTGENIILFGKGGYAKSEFSSAFFKSKNIVPFVKTMGSGTTTDSLFGGINILELNNTGKLEYLVENSFMNHEYVIFEELLDAPDYILEQLKDILTSGKFRNGSQSFDIKTKLIVCCTNKTRTEFSKNDSLKALMERFPLEYNVGWDSHTKETYNFLFKTVLGKDYPELEFILEKLAKNDATVSPRTAIKAAKIIDSCGDFTCLDFIADFAGKNKALVKDELNKFKNVKVINDLIVETKKEINECESHSLTTLEGIKAIRGCIKNIQLLTEKLSKRKADDEMVSVQAEHKQLFTQYVTRKLQAVNNATE
jgi:MoxR-like ATPase